MPYRELSGFGLDLQCVVVSDPDVFHVLDGENGYAVYGTPKPCHRAASQGATGPFRRLPERHVRLFPSVRSAAPHTHISHGQHDLTGERSFHINVKLLNSPLLEIIVLRENCTRKIRGIGG